jgi:hypothetical protein
LYAPRGRESKYVRAMLAMLNVEIKELPPQATTLPVTSIPVCYSRFITSTLTDEPVCVISWGVQCNH